MILTSSQTKIYIQKKQLLSIQAFTDKKTVPHIHRKQNHRREKNSATKEEQGATDWQSRAKRNRV